MDKTAFRQWLASDAATEQLKKAVEAGMEEDRCTDCGEPIADGEYFSYYGVLDDVGPLCCWCGGEIAGMD